jgi:hypothetical protein
MIGCTENMSPLYRNREKKISHSAHLSSDLGRHRRNYLVILVNTMMTHYIKRKRIKGLKSYIIGAIKGIKPNTYTEY